ncbi:MAG TPA: hypothetical protein VHW09_23365 [Bryobacteraceae bacterium]|jgi:hypothetical protein|nr:hypothetical protein [Bryobacteraceae bacterium]
MVRLSGLLLCAAMAWGQHPSDSDSATLIERARQKALDYTRSLPDFVCAESVHRFAARPERSFSRTDVLTVKLRYLQGKEEHSLSQIDGKPTDKKYEDLAFATGSGEFGGILRTVFDPASQAAFEWKGWKTVRKRRAAAYEYAVSAAHAPYVLTANHVKAVVGIHGVVELDSETGEALFLSYIAYELPRDFDAQYAASSVDYEWTNVGGRNYLLPSHSQQEVHGVRIWTLNKIDFHDYGKFSADAVIDFGTGK